MNYMFAEERADGSDVARTWSSFTEVMFLEGQGEAVVTNLGYDEAPQGTTTSGGRWSEEFKRATVDAILKWRSQPKNRQLMKWLAKMDAGNFLGSLTDRELEQWRVHVRNNHMPYDRRCKTCVESGGTGRKHVKIKTPSSYCLSLDVCGPFRNRGVDPDHADYRSALVGAYVVPDLEVRDGSPHEGEVRDGGPHGSEVRDGGPHGGEVRDGGPLKDDDSRVPVRDGDFVPEVAEDAGIGVGPLRDWRDEDLVDEQEPVGLTAEEERRLPKGMTAEEFQQVFHQVGGREWIPRDLCGQSFTFSNNQGCSLCATRSLSTTSSSRMPYIQGPCRPSKRTQK